MPGMLQYASCRTPEEFDRGYANRITPEVVARWETWFRERSEALLASPAPRRELAYGPHPRQRIDFFPAPDAKPGAPVLIAIHGGLWFLFDRWMMHALVAAFNAAGVHVACPGYRLAPEHPLSAIVDDCRRAVLCLHAHASELGIDSRRFVGLGHSAAGQLVATTAAARWDALAPGEGFGGLRRWIGVSGFYDIEPFSLTGFQDRVRFTREDYADYNPMRLVRASLPPPLLITGAKESDLLHEMAGHLIHRLNHAGVRNRHVDAAGHCHFSVLAAIGDPLSPVHRDVLAWARG